MQNVTGSRQPAPSDDRDRIYRAVVADLASLIEHIQASLTMIESALAMEASAAFRTWPQTWLCWTMSPLAT